MRSDPPEWLKDVVTQHSPVFTYSDIVCLTCSTEYAVTWSPEHLARMIHLTMDRLECGWWERM